MRRGVCLVLFLAGCGGSGPETPQDACARQANDAPAVRDLLMKAAGSPYIEYSQQVQLHNARQDATLTCLRTRGLAPRGSVERPLPR